MTIEPLLQRLVAAIQPVQGVQAIVLGGSRARGRHTPASDIDLGIYYDPLYPLDLEALDRVAASLDDRQQTGRLTPLGGWGPWINGGGWLKVQSTPVDLLYRDLEKVRTVLADCLDGKIDIFYQPGHPHGFVTSIYLAEVAVCRPLYDPAGLVQELKAQVQPYPAALQKAVVNRFAWEIDFSVEMAHKSVERADVAYAAGCCFRAVMCMLQVLFALNREHWLNEKGAAAMAQGLALRPEGLQDRLERTFALLEAEPGSIRKAVAVLRELGREVMLLCQAVK
jgi:predicted nucleotidyltransferase